MNIVDINPDRYSRTAEEQAALRDLVSKANQDAQDNWEDPAWHKSYAAALTGAIYEGFQHENILSLMANVENLAKDGRSFVSETRGIKVHWMAKGGKPEASFIDTKRFEITGDTIAFHVYDFEEKMKSNFAESTATMIDLSVERMDATINQRVFSLFQDAAPASNANDNWTSGFSLATLNTALAQVRDRSRTRDVTIIGRSTMTDQIMDEIIALGSGYGGFLPATNEDLLRRGVLGTYRGAQIITVNNYLDEDDEPFIPGNELFVAAKDASKFAFFGGMESKEWNEQDNWYWHYIAKREFGGVVHKPERIHRFVDPDVDA